MPMEDKYAKKVLELNIPLFTVEELTQENDWLSEFFGFACLKKIEKVIDKVKTVNQIFEGGQRAFEARNEFEEAALADLRHEMEILFYQIKEDFPGNEFMQSGALSDSMKVLISIFVNVPTIMTDRAKDEILDYAVKNNLLRN